MADVVAVLLVELVVRDGRERLAPERDRLLDRETDSLRGRRRRRRQGRALDERGKENEGAHFEEEAVLLPALVLEVLAALERVLHVAHAQREALVGELGHHLGRDGLAVGRRDERVVGRDAGHEAHREVREDRDEASVLVESRKCLGRELRGASVSTSCSSKERKRRDAPRALVLAGTQTRRRRASTPATTGRTPCRLAAAPCAGRRGPSPWSTRPAGA